MVYNAAPQYDGTIEGDPILFSVTSSGDPPIRERNFVRRR
jgi:hypothetical protein